MLRLMFVGLNLSRVDVMLDLLETGGAAEVDIGLWSFARPETVMVPL